MRFRTANLAIVLGLAMLASSCGGRDPQGGDPRLDAAVTLYRQQGAESALPEFEKLAAEFGGNARSANLATAVHYVGECHWRLGQYVEARAKLDQALALARGRRDRAAEGRTLNVLGLLEWDLGRYEDAQADFRTARVIGRDLGDPKLEGSALNNLSLVYDELGDYDTSLEQYGQVLELYRDADFPRGEGDTLGNIGGVHLLLGRYGEALRYYRQALAISEKLESTASMSQDHGNIALALLGQGDLDAALANFDRAIELARQAGMRQDEAYWLLGKAGALIRQGRYDQGVTLQRAALAQYEELGAQTELVEALQAAGDLHILLGDVETAERHFQRAAELARSIGLARGITASGIALGDLAFRRHQYAEAAREFEEARKRADEAGEQQLLATSLLRLALAHRSQDKLDAADGEVAEALHVSREIGAHAAEAEALFAEAELARVRGRLPTALDGYAAVEALDPPVQDPELLWQIHYGRARALEAGGDKSAAIDALLAAAQVIEGVRSRLREQRFRAGYVEDKYQVFEDLVRLQLELGRTTEAFSSAERLRARSYAEQLGGHVAMPLSEPDRRRETELRARIRQLQRSLDGESDGSWPLQRQQAIGQITRELQAAEREYQSFLDDRTGVAAAGPMPPVPSAQAVQRRLDPDETLLEYVVGRESTTVFVLSARELAAVVLPVARDDLIARIALLRDLLQQPRDERWRKPAAALSMALIDPVEAVASLRGVRRLYIVPHGILNQLPYAVLPVTGDAARRLLVDRYDVAYLPTAMTLLNDPASQVRAPSVLAMAPARSRLRFAPEEARMVGQLFEPRAQVSIGSAATEGRFKREAGRFEVIHLATHGTFNRKNPLLSGVELEADDDDDGLLQVHEVLGLRLSADLVTLSACETGLGSGYLADIPVGDAFVGMTRAFLATGSSAVLATLWEVDDQSSVQFMRRFYQDLVGSDHGRDKAAALASAQRELRRIPALKHPYYWAPFVLVGQAGATKEMGRELAGGPKNEVF